MKLFLSIDQAKTIRDALYHHKDKLKASLAEKAQPSAIVDIVEAEMQEQDRLLGFLNEQIRKETE